ncbi:AAA family ATPase [Rhodoplanes sp. Z2-YC6860]|uniref:AAA family ATPase n=1 Tax=Rhodoplanes sp. Z2-YC6860 TaxID=674703 RepID=UPI00078E223A|nr:AAA family ATPase [Rhodoplanes sp. Z2-YC6860]AMN40128.1 RecF-like ATPase [Rhodoplanes sp. Z2-YC6860]
MIDRLAVSGYRSLRDIRLALGRLTVVTGPNGSGKSSLYRALRLLADVAQDRVVQSLAAEGGLQSTLWAGPEQFSREMKSGKQPIQGTVRKNPVALKLGFSDEHYGYSIELGLPPPSSALFGHDPDIKLECLWTGETIRRNNVFAERRGPLVRIRDDGGAWRDVITTLHPFDSMMTHGADPRDALELLVVREQMREWRFYDHLRTDRDAPARRPQVGTYTPVLSGDGADVASAVQTIKELGNAQAVYEAIADAFPGSRLSTTSSNGYYELEVHQHGLLRPLKSAELSDGTLRYILLTAALLSPRPPPLMVLNEPETSLHADLLPALARLIARAAKNCQVVVVTHAAPLVAALCEQPNATRIALEKALGETSAPDHDPPAWSWPAR